MDQNQRKGDAIFDVLWERLRAEERSERLAWVVQDTVRDARTADTLIAAQRH